MVVSFSECSPGYYGPGCHFNCTCQNNGVCNRFSGSCECLQGYYEEESVNMVNRVGLLWHQCILRFKTYFLNIKSNIFTLYQIRNTVSALMYILTDFIALISRCSQLPWLSNWICLFFLKLLFEKQLYGSMIIWRRHK